MKPWSIAIAIVASLAVLALLAEGDDDRSFATRARAEETRRPAHQIEGSSGTAGPEQTIIVVLDLGVVPPAAEQLLNEVRELVATTRDQSPEEAKDTLEEARDKLEQAMDQVEEAADDTSNQVVKMRLEQVHAALEAVDDWIELQIDGL